MQQFQDRASFWKRFENLPIKIGFLIKHIWRAANIKEYAFRKIDVTGIDDYSGKGKYPKVTKKVGKSPPQYPDFENE